MSTKYIASNWRLPNKAGVDSYLNDNYGLSFDGSSEYIAINDGITLNSSGYSLSMWFNAASFSSVQCLVFDNSSNIKFISIDSATSIRFRDGVNERSFTVPTMSVSNWYNIIVTVDNGSCKVFLNTTESTSGAQTIDQNWTINGINGYSNIHGGSFNFNGSISELSIFDYALSSTQISTLYGSSSLGSASPLALKPAPVAFYPLGDNSSGNPLTQPNEAVEDASVFDFEPSETITTSNPFTSIVTGSNVIGICTISYWLKVAGGSQQSFMELVNSATHTAGFRIDSNNKPYYINSQGGRYKRFAALSNPSDWNHWCWIFPSDTSYADAKLYINGVEKSVDFDFSAAPANNAWNGFYINKFQTGSSATFQMSNLQLWSGNLSESEITTLYNSGVPLLTGTQPQASNLKAWYKLDQSANWDVSGSGYWDIPDASGNGNDGTSSGMTSASLVLSDLTRNLPYDSYSFNFDAASSDYIEISSVLPLQSVSSFSISMWVNWNGHSAGSDQWMFMHANSGNTKRIQLEIFSSDLFFQLTGTGGGFARVDMPQGQWVNLLCVFNSSEADADKMIVYINGERASNVAYSAPTMTTTETDYTYSMIGARNDGFCFDGKISNVSVFDEALTSTEVMKLYSNGMPQDLSSFTPAPVAWYTLGSNSFWNGSQWTVRNMIGSNDGTGVNLGQDALVGNSPRSEANGTGTNQSIPENLVGTTKYSSNNSWSINMSESARVADTP